MERFSHPHLSYCTALLSWIRLLIKMTTTFKHSPVEWHNKDIGFSLSAEMVHLVHCGCAPLFIPSFQWSHSIPVLSSSPHSQLPMGSFNPCPILLYSFPASNGLIQSLSYPPLFIPSFQWSHSIPVLSSSIHSQLPMGSFNLCPILLPKLLLQLHVFKHLTW
jgi:hypothetical protein